MEVSIFRVADHQWWCQLYQSSKTIHVHAKYNTHPSTVLEMILYPGTVASWQDNTKLSNYNNLQQFTIHFYMLQNHTDAKFGGISMNIALIHVSSIYRFYKGVSLVTHEQISAGPSFN